MVQHDRIGLELSKVIEGGVSLKSLLLDALIDILFVELVKLSKLISTIRGVTVE